MVRGFWRHIGYNYREGGLRQIARKIFWRIGQWICSDAVWLIYHEDLQHFSMEARLPLTERAMDFKELLAVEYFKAVAFPEGVQRRIESGSRAHGFFLNGRFVNIGWTSRGGLEPEPAIRIVDDNCIGIHDCFTLPEFRSMGIYTDSLIRMLKYGQAEGALRALIAVDPVNAPSIRAIEKVGFQPLRRLTIRRRFGKRFTRESPF